MDLSTITKKRTEIHDEMISRACRWAESLGYEVVDFNTGNKRGADAIFQNIHKERVLLEVVTGSSFIELLKKRTNHRGIEKRNGLWTHCSG